MRRSMHFGITALVRIEETAMKSLSRRSMLKVAFGATGTVALGVLAACTSGATPSAPAAPTTAPAAAPTAAAAKPAAPTAAPAAAASAPQAPAATTAAAHTAAAALTGSEPAAVF